MTRSRRTGLHRRPWRRGGFSLIEVLLAIFILGIGIISVGAIFPAGIVQQRQALDDAMGPIVADNAIAMLRTRLSQEDFGFAEDFVTFPFAQLSLASHEFTYGGYVDTARTFGDWGWRRPGLLLENWSSDQVNYPDFGGNNNVPPGSLLIFNNIARPQGLPIGVGVTASEIPWNRRKYGPATDDGSNGFGDFPIVTLEPWERAFPSFPPGSQMAVENPPQYFWECMFRRFQGRILVAIFVYRVSGAEQIGRYIPEQAQAFSSPPRTGLPHRFNVAVPWDAAADTDTAIVPNTNANTTLDLANPDFQWQLPGQWLIDPNNTVHRIGSGRRTSREGPVRLMAPLPRLPDPTPDATNSMRSYFSMGSNPGDVGTVWYLPSEDDRGYQLTPVYVAVKEL